LKLSDLAQNYWTYYIQYVVRFWSDE